MTLKQTRSMQQMQKIQPQLKELQRKYKGNRQKLNEELQKLYKEHQVNPLGGCLPLLLQIPVFIALYAVLRATVGAFGVPDVAVPMTEVNASTVVCRPNTDPAVSGESPTQVICENGNDTEVYDIEEWRAKNSREDIARAPSEVAFCRPEADDDDNVAGFLCESRQGPGHLPPDSALYAEIVEEGSTFLGMELSCSPNQAADETQVKLCAGPDAQGSTTQAIPYYIMVVLMAGTTYYQQRQMQRDQSGPTGAADADDGHPHARFLALHLAPDRRRRAGVLGDHEPWQIGQQAVMLRRRRRRRWRSRHRPPRPTPKPKGNGQTSKGSGNARNRKKRRKR